MAARGTKTLEIGDVIGTTFGVWLKNFVPFSLLSVVIFSPLLLLTLQSRGADPDTARKLEMLSTLLQYALGFVAAGAFTYGVVQSMRGKTVGAGECLSVGISRLLPVLGVSILVSLCILGGFVLLIVPGYVVMCMLMVAVPVAVLEKPGLMASLKRSRALTSGFKWTIFFVLFVLGILGFLVGLVLAVLFDRLGTTGHLLTTALVSIVAGALQAALPAVIYQRLREIKEGTSVEDLAKVFD